MKRIYMFTSILLALCAYQVCSATLLVMPSPQGFGTVTKAETLVVPGSVGVGGSGTVLVPGVIPPVANYYVSAAGDNSNGLTWATAWQTFSDISWATVGNTGAIVNIDEGRWEETLTVGSVGAPTVDLSVSSHESLSTASLNSLASGGWLVITVGASDGVLSEEARIVGSELQGKTVEGTANSGFSNTSGNVYEVALTTAPKGVWEAITTDLTTKDAAVPLSLQSSIVTVEANAGSYWWDTAVDKLYIHKTGGGDVSASLYDYEATFTGQIPLDLSSSVGVVFDGGAGQNLRISYGDATANGGIIAGTNVAGSSTIFRNMKMLYADTADNHFMNGLAIKSLYYNNNMGKVSGNQAFSQSNADAGTYNNIEVFFIDNVIWDGMETHGGATATNNIVTWYVKNNEFKYERMGNIGGDQGTEGLIRLARVVGVSADIQVSDNTFTDVDEFIEIQASFASAIAITPEYAGTGDIVVSGNSIVSTAPNTTAAGAGVFVQNTNGNTIAVSGNTISGLTNQPAVYAKDQTTPIYIDGNTTANNQSATLFATTTTAYIRENYFQETVVIVANGTISGTVYFDRNICIAQGATNFIYLRGMANVYMRNNFIDQTGTGSNYLTLYSISTVTDVIGNIFTGISDVWGFIVRGAGSADVNLYGNIFYGNTTGFTLHSGADCDVIARNNILQGNTSGFRSEHTTQFFDTNYNYFYSNTTDVRVAGGQPAHTFGLADVRGTDPQMTSPATGNYLLDSESPCIGSGDVTVDQIPYRFVIGTDFTNPPAVWYVVNDEPAVWSIGDLYDR